LTLAVGATVAACSGDADAPPPAATGSAASPVQLELVAPESGPVPLGEAFDFTVVAHNSGARSVSIDADLELTSPDGSTVPFNTAALFVPHEGEVSQDVGVTPAQWFAGEGRYELRASITDPAAAEATLSFEVSAPAVVVPEFEDATAAAGLTTTVPEAQCGQLANGAA
jgi:hypothetical protein